MKLNWDDISCCEEFLELIGWSLDLPEEEQAQIERRYSAELAEIRNAMWQRHYNRLDASERTSLDAGEHPSDSWDSAERGEPYLAELRNQVDGTDLVKQVTMDRYHGDTIAFTVHLSRPAGWREYRKVIPEFFRGFQVFVIEP